MPMLTMIHRTRIIITIITYLRDLVKLNSQHVQKKPSWGLTHQPTSEFFSGLGIFFELDKTP